MRENLAKICFTILFVEIVHVELPDKRREIGMFEVLGQDLQAEGVRILYNEALELGFLPSNYIISCVIIHNLI